MQVPFLDLKSQYAAIREEINAAVLDVLESQQFILGPKVEQCERAVADYCQAAHGVGVSSGTDALLAALMAERIGPGDEVITTPYTFFATVGAIARVGAMPVFVDIDPATYNIDPALIERQITPRTRAIVPVHLFGQCAEMDPIMEIARRHALVVIEDAAQAIGAESRGRRAGSIGDYGCFSFFPSKNLGCAGDGGMVTTQDGDRAARLRILRAHGSKPKYHHPLIGGNFRLDAIQAAIVSVKLKYLDRWTAARQTNAALYRQLFAEAGLVDSMISLPDVGGQRSQVGVQQHTTNQPRSTKHEATSTKHDAPSTTHELPRHIYNQFVLRVADRDGLQAHLKAAGIASEVYYPVPMHRQECFADLGYDEGQLPESERAARETLAIPIHPELSDEQVAHVVDTMGGFYR